MIQRQPSDSRSDVPALPRLAATAATFRSLSQPNEVAGAPRWRVQLELAPAEIAFVYRHGLARGAEVCRSGTHDWRPLVTTPELRQALAKRSPSTAATQPPLAALMLAQAAAIKDPGLAKLFLVRRPPQSPKSVPPPPPPVPKAATSTTALMIDLPGFPLPEETAASLEPVPARPPLPPLPVPLSRHSRALAVLHARPIELSIVAAIAILLTLAVSALTVRTQKVGAYSSQVHTPSGNEPAPGPRAALSIPVVSFRDLPLESGASRPAVAEAAVSRAGHSHGASQSSAPDRGSLSRALAHAARSAHACGSAPVNAQVVVTFAPSGVVRDVHFTTPPPPDLRSCILRAVSRAQLTPFSGEPITVSKTLRWD